MKNYICLANGQFEKKLINQGLWLTLLILCTKLSTEVVESAGYLFGNIVMHRIAQFIGINTKPNKIKCLGLSTELLHNVIHKSCAKLSLTLSVWQ